VSDVVCGEVPFQRRCDKDGVDRRVIGGQAKPEHFK
jgi:hypothetical protein